MKKAPSDTGGACLVRPVWLQPNDTAQVPPVVVLVVVVVFLVMKLDINAPPNGDTGNCKAGRAVTRRLFASGGLD
jgi:hypothetical protein